MNVSSRLIHSLLFFIFNFQCGMCDQISLIDLEDHIQDFVLETKKIEIPNYPHAFNASMIRWNGKLLMSFRVIPNPLSSFVCYIGVVWLDDNFCPQGETQLLDLRKYDVTPSRAEDARLLVINQKLYIIYDDNVEPKLSKGGFRVYVGEISLEDNIFHVHNPECLTVFEGASREVREKSWVPFDYQGNLFLTYSITPHRIFRPLLDGSGICETISVTTSNLRWPWGEPRGGTPGIQLDEHSYLSFFHSSIYMPTLNSDGKTITHYFMGAYLFNAKPPFEITHVSSRPIIGKNFYTGEMYKHYWKPIRAVFPCGFIHDDQYIWVAYGRQDHEVWIMKLDKRGLLNHLVPVSSGRD